MLLLLTKVFTAPIIRCWATASVISLNEYIANIWASPISVSCESTSPRFPSKMLAVNLTSTSTVHADASCTVCGFHSASEVRCIWGYESCLSAVGVEECKKVVVPAMVSGIRSSGVSIPIGSPGLKGLPWTDTPLKRSWFGLMSEFESQSQNHNPSWIINIDVRPDLWRVNAVATLTIGTSRSGAYAVEL